VFATNTSGALDEASGLAVSVNNPGVLWTQNDDGSDGRVFAFTTNGVILAQFDIEIGSLKDIEELAVGPGPAAGVSYLYAGDIGGSASQNGVRASVRILRVPEPNVPLAWASDPRTRDFNGLDRFTLRYPDGSYDAEAMLVDPLSGDIFIGTKQTNETRLYRANLNGARDGATLELQHVATLSINGASGASISADGRYIALRNERRADFWFRCGGESVAAAVARPEIPLPLIGQPIELNGEAIALLPDGSGYFTISDSTVSPPLYFFPRACLPDAPATQIVVQPQGGILHPGLQLAVVATGQNLRYQWRRDGADIPGATSAVLSFSDAQNETSGIYTVQVTGDGGSVVSSPAFVFVPQPSATPGTPEPQILLPPSGGAVRLGGWTRLFVVASGEEPMTVTWTRNGEHVGSGPTLTVTKARYAKAGTYRVTVSNAYGEAAAEADVQVLRAPRVRVTPRIKRVRAGSDVLLRAHAVGDEPIAYQWSVNGQMLPDQNGSELYLPGVQFGHSGKYTVTVVNPVGTATASARVVVR
jgi:hypothetical protein